MNVNYITSKSIMLKDLKPGDVFKFAGTAFITTGSISGIHGEPRDSECIQDEDTVIAVRLEDGKLRYLDADEGVRVCKAELTVREVIE